MFRRNEVLIIYHRVDFDGIFSCCIAKDHYSKNPNNFITTLGWNYGDDLPNFDEIINTYNEVVMVDISFKPEYMIKMKEVLQYPTYALNGITWIDHHFTAIQDSVKFGYSDLQGIRGYEYSAAEYCWNYYNKKEAPKIVKYISTYDNWNKTRFDWENDTLPLQYSLKEHYSVSEKNIWGDWKNLIEDEEYLEDLIYDGRLIYSFLKKHWKSAVKNFSFPVRVAGKYNGVCIISTEFGSNQFESVLNEYDIYIVVNRRGPDCFSISMYKEPDRITEFSCGGYTTKLGNTQMGHISASGSQLNLKQFEQLIETCEV